MKLQEEILKIKNEMIDEFDKRVEALKEEEQEFPQDGDIYWLINTAGETNWVHWHDTEIDSKRLSFGNVLKTKDEAEFAVEKLKVESELRKFSRPFKDSDNNYFIKLHLFDKTLSIDSGEYFQTQGTIYFESTTVANEAVDTIGAERIKKYIFGVGE